MTDSHGHHHHDHQHGRRENVGHTDEHSHAADHDHGHSHALATEADWARWAQDAELEGEVLIGFVGAAIDRVLEHTGGTAPQRIADLGAGPGVAACEFARRFPEATVLAVDGSPAMLARAQARADRLGVAARVHTVVGEMPHELGFTDGVDLLWASMSLHHVGDEVAALRSFLSGLAPGGLMVIAEVADALHLLPDEMTIGRPGLAQRFETAWSTWFAHMRDGLPGAVASRDLATMVREAGATVIDDRVVRVRFDAPLPAEVQAFAVTNLQRARTALDGLLDADDRDTLAKLLDAADPHALFARDDTYIEASRRIIVAQSSNS